MIDKEFVRKMFSIPQENHPEKAWVISRLLEQDGSVIYDLGCGKNKTVEMAIGMDINPVTDLVGSIDDLFSIPSYSADVVISRHSLEHMIDPVLALLEWTRILKEEGKIIIVLPDHEKIDTMDMMLSAGKHLHAFTMDSFASLVSMIPGIEIKELRPVVKGWSFGAVLKKIKKEIYAYY